MVQINFPEPDFKIKKEAGREFIFDTLRKKWVMLTPEEWVRQNFLRYLLVIKKYPPPLIAIEKEIKLGELKKRFDILVYNSRHQPWVMVECKAINIKLDEKVLHQLLRYNISIPVEYLVVTNGSATFAWQRKEDGMGLIKELPEAT